MNGEDQENGRGDLEDRVRVSMKEESPIRRANRANLLNLGAIPLQQVMRSMMEKKFKLLFSVSIWWP